ncbi:transporter substrate-binding domain-containing protein [uncultured Alteromonas sp.]|jgi:ABC-type amino acid transport substrate-binding protein|uniref:transporter substrate-binding domain-containing protein n=1 Tax=uncultured Alteromonas sp. TaxID=179113 RepID=UPI0025FAA3CF|nr:transporter substrate-binding domain-containing protein [uncultured Alteromonas sp.]
MKRLPGIRLILAAVLAGGLQGMVNTCQAQPNAFNDVSQINIPTYQPGTGEFYFYIKTLLSLALAQTDNQYGPVILVPDAQVVSQQKQFEELARGRTDITWSITTIKREQQHIAVRVPLTAGLFGYRVILVRAADDRFNHALSLSELKALTAVQGTGWPDNSILTFNGFTLETDSYAGAFARLSAGQADYYPRAAHEVFEELESRSAEGFVIARHITLQYDNPMFFFVTKNKPELAKRLQKGLQILAANGDMSRLLTSQHFYIRARNLLAGRTLISIANPLLSDPTKKAISHYNSPLKHLF